MILKKLTLQNFRNYKKIEIPFSDNINIFFGNNAQGKTNILEAIYILAITKSYRTTIDSEIINFNAVNTKIIGNLKKNDLLVKLEVLVSNKEKKIKKNNKVVRKFSDYISNLNVVFFNPDELEIIKGSPSDRRKFLNIEIGQLDNTYINILNNYNALLKNRNEYLKSLYLKKTIDKKYLEVITDKLIDFSIKIYEFRKKFVLDINKELISICKELLEKDIKIKYNSFIDDLNDKNVDIKKILKHEFDNIYEKEIRYGNTLIGPHKDDLIFYIDEREIKKYGSQGQQRAVILSLKLAELNIFKKNMGEYPIFLLDDVLSELDEAKKNILLKKINKNIQTIITTTNLDNISDKILKKANIFYVENATLKQTDKVV